MKWEDQAEREFDERVTLLHVFDNKMLEWHKNKKTLKLYKHEYVFFVKKYFFCHVDDQV